MYRLYVVLKDQGEPPTADEIAIASGRQVLDPTKAAAYLDQLKKASTTIVDLFHHQAEETKARNCTFFYPFYVLNICRSLRTRGRLLIKRYLKIIFTNG